MQGTDFRVYSAYDGLFLWLMNNPVISCFCFRLNHLVNFQSVLEKICFEAVWKTNRNRISLLELVVSTKENFLFHLLSESPVLSNLVFIPYSCTLENYIVSMPKPIQYRKLKSKIAFARVQV